MVSSGFFQRCDCIMSVEISDLLTKSYLEEHTLSRTESIQ